MMALTYTIRNQYSQHFITSTVHQWTDVFTRKEYIDILLASIRYCQQHKGLKVYAWVVMTNHVHLIISSDKDKLSDIIRDLKKFTAKQIFEAIRNNPKEKQKRMVTLVVAKRQ